MNVSSGKGNFLGRKNLKIFTKISLFTALVTIIVISITYIYVSLRTSDESVEPIIRVFANLAFFASVFGIPLSIVSKFSKENLAKRIFALIINLLPISIIGFGITMEFIDELFRTAP